MKRWPWNAAAAEMPDHGLSENQLRIIKDVLVRNAFGVDKVSLYGSRATGKHRSNSDIDLVLYGDLDEALGDRLFTLFSESFLPYKVDLVIYRHVSNPSLKRHIDRQSRILFTKEQLRGRQKAWPLPQRTRA